MGDQRAKADAGKAKISLVPPQIIYDIAQVREYGNRKYGDPDNWKTVEAERYIDALGRHFLAMLADPLSKDPESGIEHYKHCACNMAFLCELLKNMAEEDEEDTRISVYENLWNTLKESMNAQQNHWMPGHEVFMNMVHMEKIQKGIPDEEEEDEE